MLLRSFPPLLVIAAVFLGPLPLSCLVMSYNSLALPFSAVVWVLILLPVLLRPDLVLCSLWLGDVQLGLDFLLFVYHLPRMLAVPGFALAFLKTKDLLRWLVCLPMNLPQLSTTSPSSTLFSTNLRLTASQYICFVPLSFSLSVLNLDLNFFMLHTCWVSSISKSWRGSYRCWHRLPSTL